MAVPTPALKLTTPLVGYLGAVPLGAFAAPLKDSVWLPV